MENYSEESQKEQINAALKSVLEIVDKLGAVVKDHGEIIENFSERILHLEEVEDGIINELKAHMRIMESQMDREKLINENIDLIMKNFL